MFAVIRTEIAAKKGAWLDEFFPYPNKSTPKDEKGKFTRDVERESQAMPVSKDESAGQPSEPVKMPVNRKENKLSKSKLDKMPTIKNPIHRKKASPNAGGKGYRFSQKASRRS